MAIVWQLLADNRAGVRNSAPEAPPGRCLALAAQRRGAPSTLGYLVHSFSTVPTREHATNDRLNSDNPRAIRQDMKAGGRREE